MSGRVSTSEPAIQVGIIDKIDKIEIVSGVLSELTLAVFVFARCLSVSYDPVRRECRLSRYDQTGSRIVYDPEHDYYENLIGE